jgi:hypothetical protein
MSVVGAKAENIGSQRAFRLFTLNRRIGMFAVRSGVKRGAYQHLIGSRASATLFRVGPTPTDGWACHGLCPPAFEKVPARSSYGP